MSKMISIIVPIYNSDQYLSECIESILNQTHKNIEIILVNDGSTDNSLQICKKYEAQDERVVVIDKQNSGVSSSRNIGLDIAKGDYIGFVDSDDTIDPNMYETLLSSLSNNDSELAVLCSFTINPTSQRVLNHNAIDTHEALNDLLLLRFPSSLWAYLYSKELFDGLRLDTDIHFFEDLELNFRVLKNATRVSIVDQKLYHYRTHSENTNNQNINKKRMSCLKIYDKILSLIDSSKLMNSLIYFNVHCVVSIVLSLAKSVDNNDEFIFITKTHMKQYLKEALFSNYIPMKFKILSFFFTLFPHLTLKLLSILKYRSRT